MFIYSYTVYRMLLILYTGSIRFQSVDSTSIRLWVFFLPSYLLTTPGVVCRELIFSQTEDYVEYSRHGKVLKGEEQTTIRSRYEEDVLNTNHTTVWGSWWQGGQWGYKCCHSTLRNSYCTGGWGGRGDTCLTSVASPVQSVCGNGAV